MIQMSTKYYDAISASVRQVAASVGLYNNDSSTVKRKFSDYDELKSFEIQRTGEDSKFFGFGVSHKLSLKLLDPYRRTSFDSATQHLKVQFAISTGPQLYEYVSFPKFFVTEVNRNENTNELSVTAYDALHKAAQITVADIGLAVPYSIREFINLSATALGLAGVRIPADIPEFDLEYETGANFEGTEFLKDGLVAAAEATQTIYFVNKANQLEFVRLDKDGSAVKTITKNDYISLEAGANRRLSTVCSATELGDNYSASLEVTGTTQYVRNNPFWELREDIADLVDNALAAMGGMTINQFECSWRGDFSLTPGDKLAFTTKDNKVVTSYLLNDTISYDGSLSEKTEWKYSDNDGETASNPTTLGDALKKTYAKVDKANQEIELVASKQEGIANEISSLKLNTDSIAASVSKIESDNSEALDSIHNDINTLTKQVEATMTSEDVTIAIKSELNNGVNKVTTETGFRFDEEGLTVSKSGSEMTTTITEDGMTVYRDEEAMLIANNEGVNAVNLHASTYLIIGENSRFEDWDKDGEARTGCFWIGG